MAAPGTPKATRTPSLSSTLTAACIAVIFAIEVPSSVRRTNGEGFGRRVARFQEAFPRCGNARSSLFIFSYLDVSTIGQGDGIGRLAHESAQDRNAHVGNTHRRPGYRDCANGLAMLVADDRGDAAKAYRVLLVIDGVAALPATIEVFP